MKHHYDCSQQINITEVHQLAWQEINMSPQVQTKELVNNIQPQAPICKKYLKSKIIFLMGLSGLATDIQTFSLEMRRKVELYRVKENVDLTPKLFINLVSSTLNKHRFSPFFKQQQQDQMLKIIINHMSNVMIPQDVLLNLGSSKWVGL